MQNQTMHDSSATSGQRILGNHMPNPHPNTTQLTQLQQLQSLNEIKSIETEFNDTQAKIT